MPNKRYRYTVRMASWTGDLEDFHKLKTYAQQHFKDFWWNYMGGTLAAFSFWAYPNEIAAIMETEKWNPLSLSIDVGRGAVPREEY